MRALVFLLAVAGLGPALPAATPASRPATQPATRPLDPDKSFALANYQQAVKASLPSPTTARFERDPFVRISDAGELVAVGFVDAQNPDGVPVRSSFRVVWQKRDRGWQLKKVFVLPRE